MSADFTLVFYGVRWSVPEEEMEQLELRRHPRQFAARNGGLDSWWGRSSAPSGEDAYFLFVGAKLGSFGIEGLLEICLSREDLMATMDKVGEKLKQLGIEQAPRLHVQFCPDD